MNYQTEVTNKKNGLRTVVCVEWNFNLFDLSAQILAVKDGRDDIYLHVPIRELKRIRKELERIALDLTLEQREREFLQAISK